MKLSPHVEARTFGLADPGSLLYTPTDRWEIRCEESKILRLADHRAVACDDDALVLDYGTDWTVSVDPESACKVSELVDSKAMEGGGLCLFPGPQAPAIIILNASAGAFDMVHLVTGARHTATTRGPDGFIFRRWSILVPTAHGAIQIYPTPPQSE